MPLSEKSKAHRKEYKKNWQNRNRDKLKLYKAHWEAKNKEKSLEIKRRILRRHYAKHKQRVLEKTAAYYLRNKERIYLQRIKRYELNKEKEKLQNILYRNTPKGKAVRRLINSKRRKGTNGFKVSANSLKDLMEKYPYCLNCGDTNRLEVDHIIPLSKGGLHVIENMQILCKICNTKKGVKVHDFRIK